jgi:hypothetical protein
LKPTVFALAMSFAVMSKSELDAVNPESAMLKLDM